MQIPIVNWNLSIEEAIRQQAELALLVRTEDDGRTLKIVAGVDVGLEEETAIALAAVVALAFPSLAPLGGAVARLPITFPYVPGLLAYRELPVVLEAFRQLTYDPDLIIVDGHGYAHPRRCGIACQLGILLDKPTIGCAKSILVGRAAPTENRVGAWTPLIHKGEVVGAALRTKLNTARGINPVYVSVGHRVTLGTAIEDVLRCCRGYRLPETSRLAHKVAGGGAL